MTSLPDALRPWREWLSWFEPDLSVEIGILLQRLSPLLGPFRGKSLGGEPEMEGLDDLRARGSYEHLLATEWLLAEEMPDEFLRRAASGEHIFLAPRPRARRADRSVIALFDAGPLQFGAPRLAHVAVWILLARRAQQAGGEFRWGSLQAPGQLNEASRSEHLKALLLRRTFTAPDEVGFARWRATLDESRVGGERWLIGAAIPPADFKSVPAFTHRVCLNKDLKGTALEVSLLERGVERGVRLPLPEPTRVTSLLRGVFIRESRPEFHTSDARAVALMRPPVISFDGSRVCLLLRDQPAVLMYAVPRSIKDQPAAPRYQQWSRGYSALGMTFIGKQLGVLLADDNDLRFWGSSLPNIPRPPQEGFHAPGNTADWLPLGWLRAGKAHRVCAIDQSNRLMRWDSNIQALQLESRDALGMVQINKNLLVYAYHLNSSVRTARLAAEVGKTPTKYLCDAPPGAAVLFGRGRVCAVRVEDEPDETWHIGTWSNLGFALQMRLPVGLKAVGVMREPDRRTALITLDRNTLRLHFAGGGNEILYTAPDRLVSCTVCPNTSLVALFTERRQLIVVSAAKRELLLSVQTGRQSNAGA